MGNNNSDAIENENAEAEDVKDENTEKTAETEINIGEEDKAVSENTEAEDNEAVSESAEAEDNEAVSENTEAEDNEAVSESAEVQEKKPNKYTKRIVISVAAAVAALAAVYFAGVWFYSTHFFFDTEIGNFECSNMSVAKAQEYIQNEIDNYTFTFYEKDGSEEVITGEEIHLENSPIDMLDTLKAKQNPYEWFIDYSTRRLPLDVEITYNKDALYNRITQMDFIASSKEEMQGSTEKVYYENGAYHINNENVGDVVSVNEMYNKVKPKIKELYRGMAMDKESCYGGLDNDDMMRGVLNLLNKYVSSNITYTKGDEKRVIDSDMLSTWLSVDENYSVHIDMDKAREYAMSLAEDYDTLGKTHKFTTSGGELINVEGGNFGWKVDVDKEVEELCNNIRSGEKTEREPVYKQKAQSHTPGNDIGKTYVEISIGGQRMWYYKDGELVVSSDIVTGNPYLGNSTPTGVYKIAYKERNSVLRGPGYESPVSFWMPFNGGIGLHDASWRGVFGGSIYRGGGSHGCVNLPYSTAAKVYEKITPGTPVIVY